MALPKNISLFRRDAPRYIASLMRDFGLTDIQAAGFPGNFGVESAGFTRMQEIAPLVKGSKGGLGPAQWTGPRRRAYEAWLKRKGAKPGDFEADYGFLFRELKDGEAGVIAVLKKARTIEDAVRIVMERYERPGIPHLDRRVEWGRLALDAYRVQPKTASPVPIASAAKPEVVTVLPQTAPSTWWEHLIGLRKPSALLGTNRGDTTLFRAQNQLLAAGYTEVGDPDGLWGPSTKTAVDALLREQFPAIAPPEDWPLSDEILAAIAKAESRRVAEARAAVTVAQLRARGSTPIRAPVDLTVGGSLLSALGIGKAIQETGLPEKVAAASEQASDVLSGIQAVAGLAGSAFSLAFRFWWVILLALGLCGIARGVKWALEIRALVRQGTIRQTAL